MTPTELTVIEAGYAAAPSTAPEAVAWCERYARRHAENFTVVSRVLPKRLRPAMYTVYAFCRFTDDLGDIAAGDRLALLDEWERDLERAFRGEGRHPIHRALSAVIPAYGLEITPFRRLIAANRRDQQQSRYPTYQDLLTSCDASANPVGHMVLALFGYHDAARRALADAICTALQLANHWQDVARDAAAGRIYLPLEDLRRFGVSEAQILDRRADASFRALMQFEVDRAETLFRLGEPLADTVSRELRVDLRLFTAGGRAVLRAIARQDYDVLSRRPVIPGWYKGWLAARAIVGIPGRGTCLGGG